MTAVDPPLLTEDPALVHLRRAVVRDPRGIPYRVGIE